MPDETVLTDNMLILMGLSTGAFIGIKTTEKVTHIQVKFQSHLDAY